MRTKNYSWRNGLVWLPEPKETRTAPSVDASRNCCRSSGKGLLALICTPPTCNYHTVINQIFILINFFVCKFWSKKKAWLDPLPGRHSLGRAERCALWNDCLRGWAGPWPPQCCWPRGRRTRSWRPRPGRRRSSPRSSGSQPRGTRRLRYLVTNKN